MRHHWTEKLLFLVGFFLLSGLAFAQNSPDEPELDLPPRNYAFIFDASGSMRAALAGRTRLAVAQEALVQLSAKLDPNVNASLWVYGHRLSQDDPAASCRDIEQVIALNHPNPAEFERVVRNIRAIGYTPLSNSLTQAAASLPAGESNTIVLISDGEETCAGDPCAVARNLAQTDINFVVNTVGFAVNATTRQQLECIAEVTGGVYLDAPGPDELSAALTLIAKAPGMIRIVDRNGVLLVDVPFSVTRTDGSKLGNFNGSANIPEGDYRVNVLVEPTVNQAVQLASSKVTEIVVDVAQLGAIALVNDKGERINDLAYTVTKAISGEHLGQRTGEFALPAGDYEVEVRMRVGLEKTSIALQELAIVKADEVTEILIDFPTGTIRTVDPQGQPISGIAATVSRADTGELLYSNRSGAFMVHPGDYKVMVYDLVTSTVDVSIERDDTIDIVIETRRGFIVPVDENSIPVPATLSILNTETGDVLYFQRKDSFEVPPGGYTVVVREFSGNDLRVTVGEGETVEISIVTARGSIVPVDEKGEKIVAQLQITHAHTGELMYFQRQDLFEVPPGDYAVFVRELGGAESLVTVSAGDTVTIPVIAARGFIMPVDKDGKQMVAQLQITHASTGETMYFQRQSVFEVPPGTYSVTVHENVSSTVEVTVLADETVVVAIHD